MRLFVRSAMVLGLVAVLAGVGILVARTQRPSEETVATFLETVQLETQTPAQRAKTIRRVARMLNQIRPGERERLAEKFSRSLSPAEREQFSVETQPAASGK